MPSNHIITFQAWVYHAYLKYFFHKVCEGLEVASHAIISTTDHSVNATSQFNMVPVLFVFVCWFINWSVWVMTWLLGVKCFSVKSLHTIWVYRQDCVLVFLFWKPVIIDDIHSPRSVYLFCPSHCSYVTDLEWLNFTLAQLKSPLYFPCISILFCLSFQ